MDTPNTTENKECLRYLTFTVGGESYAMPLESVREVISIPAVNRTPTMPPHFLGAANIRGRNVVIVDLRLKFGAPAAVSPETAVIIYDVDTFPVGLVVDSVNSVLSADSSRISRVSEAQLSGVYRRGDKTIFLLDIDRTLEADETQIAETCSA